MTARNQDARQDDGLAALDREAHRWITQLVSGEASTADADALRRWCKQSPAHEAAFAGAVRQWRDFGRAGQNLRARPDVPSWKPPLVSRRVALGGAGSLAAAIAGYAVVRPPFGLWPSLTELRADYRTATGEERHFTLADDIQVRMSSQTSIAIPTAANDRDRVKLIVGEAAFTNSSQRELEVATDNGRTIAKQARFDVRNIGASVCVTCFDGALRVESVARAASIGPRQQIRYDAAGLRPALTIDPAEAAAWHDGILIFHFTPLAQVIAEINRYRPGRVILMNAALAQSPVNGRFSIRRTDEVLLWIEQAFGAKPLVLPGGIVLLS